MDRKDFKGIQSRRSFLQEYAGGVGTIALWRLLALDALTAKAGEGLPNVNPLEPKAPHFTPQAKNVIYLFMSGAPSHIDLFDPKPEMKKWEGPALPPSMTKDLRLAFIKPTAKIWASPRVFTRHGQCGMEFSDFMPHLADVRRRPLYDPVDVHGAVQPPPGPIDDELRDAIARSPLHGGVAHLRARK